MGLGSGLGAPAAALAQAVKATAEPPALSEAFSPVADGAAVSVDLRFPVTASLAPVLGRFGLEGDECPFGPLPHPAGAIDAPSGDNHFVLRLTMGDPLRHAANLASCEYRIGDQGPEAVLRLRGCFLALEMSIPTARSLALQPLPAAACRDVP